MVTSLAIYLLCKHKTLRILVTSLALQWVRELGTGTTQEEVTTACTCKIQFYIILALSISIFSLVVFAILCFRKLKLYRGHLFSNAVKIMLFISDVQYYVPTKLCKTAGSIQVFKITGTLKLEDVKLKRNYIWDIIEIDWKEVNVTFNENKMNLPKSVMIKFRDKFRIRHMMKREPLLFHNMLRPGFNCSHWLPMIPQQKLYKTSIDILTEYGLWNESHCDFVFRFLWCTLPMDTIGIELTVRTVKGIHTFRKNHTTEAATCSPWSRWMKPFPSLQKRIEAYKEEKRNENSPFHPNPIQFTKKNTPNKRSRERSNRRSRQSVV